MGFFFLFCKDDVLEVNASVENPSFIKNSTLTGKDNVIHLEENANV